MRVMRRVKRNVTSNRNWMILALLAVATTAVAQQPASAPHTPPPVASTKAAPTATQSSPSAATQADSNLAPPTTMDQVVDRVILREKALIKFLAPRTPIVETYVQNLAQNAQLGPIP